jgi:hypothetical protein
MEKCIVCGEPSIIIKAFNEEYSKYHWFTFDTYLEYNKSGASFINPEYYCLNCAKRIRISTLLFDRLKGVIERKCSGCMRVFNE